MPLGRKAFLVTLPFVFFVTLVAAYFARITSYSNDFAADFCTVEDEIYQTIIQHIDAWLERIPSEQAWANATTNFPTDPLPMSDAWIHFTVPSGKTYVANGEYIVSERQPAMVFVSLGQDYPHSILGTHGYIYALEDPHLYHPPTYLKLTPLQDKIYCYYEV